MKKLKGHTILITGGTSGIGKALALALQDDNQVIITGRSPKRLEQARQEGFAAIACDMTQKNDLDHLNTLIEQQYPQLDVLINNAGVQYNYKLLEVSDVNHKIHTEIAINLTGAIQLTQMLLPVLSTKPSQILNVTSALGAVPKSDALVYSASKAGLRNFTAGLRKVLKGQSIEVLEVIPPVTDTGMTAGREAEKMSVADLTKVILHQWKQGREVIAPQKIKAFMGLGRFLPGVASRIIG